MTSSESNLNDLVNVSNLNLRVDHPNGSTAIIQKIGNLNLPNKLTLFDVFVVPEFNVNFLSVHKLCMDSKCKVLFDEYICMVQDSQSMETMETVNEGGGLYYVNSTLSRKSSYNSSVVKCFVSKLTWHIKLGHPSDQYLNALKRK